MQSRGFFATRRSTDENARNNLTARSSNGDVIRNHFPFPDSRLEDGTDGRAENHHRYGRPGRNHRDAYAKSPERSTDANYADVPPRRTRRRDYADSYEICSTWRNDASDLNASKPILRNGISHGRGERLYSSTLPRRSRTINFRDHPCNSLESRRGYPKSLQDLSDLDWEDRTRDHSVASFLSPGRDWRDDRPEDGYRRRRYREDQLEDDYLRLYRNLSRLEKYPQGRRYEPGQVHYERECRTFGKDTVAFIYYKTCYL